MQSHIILTPFHPQSSNVYLSGAPSVSNWIPTALDSFVEWRAGNGTDGCYSSTWFHESGRGSRATARKGEDVPIQGPHSMGTGFSSRRHYLRTGSTGYAVRGAVKTKHLSPLCGQETSWKGYRTDHGIWTPWKRRASPVGMVNERESRSPTSPPSRCIGVPAFKLAPFQKRDYRLIENSLSQPVGLDVTDDFEGTEDDLTPNPHGRTRNGDSIVLPTTTNDGAEHECTASSENDAQEACEVAKIESLLKRSHELLLLQRKEASPSEPVWTKRSSREPAAKLIPPVSTFPPDVLESRTSPYRNGGEISARNMEHPFRHPDSYFEYCVKKQSGNLERRNGLMAVYKVRNR
eukprot:GHVU01228864.1.p1 GENE.GHVU01228864.1~~GHVU01228864.1.p1  ORF type:complete len:348 (+),score=21.34 GHVU01228864.1:229-1272(+)